MAFYTGAASLVTTLLADGTAEQFGTELAVLRVLADIRQRLDAALAALVRKLLPCWCLGVCVCVCGLVCLTGVLC